MSEDATIWIYDDVTPDYWGGVSAKHVLRELDRIGKRKAITVRINSPGGDVVEGQAIYNALRRYSLDGGEVTTEIDALGASIASYIFQAGDKRKMAENGMQMIHRAWTIALGNAADLRSQADVLDKFDGILADTYAARSGQTREKIDELLAAETWLTSKEAVDLGLADEIGTPLNVAAAVKEGRFAKTPERLIAAQLPREAARENRIARVRQQIKLDRARMGV